MTDTEKAKAYDEAVAYAKRVLDCLAEDYRCTCMTKDDIINQYSRLFPHEEAFQDDEDSFACRKLIYGLRSLIQQGKETFAGADIEDLIDYLEKKKKPFKGPIDGVLYAAACGIKNKGQIEKSEKPMNQEGLEKEIENAWEKLEKDYSPSALDKTEILVSGLVGEKQFSNIALHFYELGKKDMKEQMLKDAVEKEVLQVTKNRIPFLTLRLDAAKYKDGDKVSIIILPKEDKQ